MRGLLVNALKTLFSKIVGLINLGFVIGFLIRIDPEQSTMRWLANTFGMHTHDMSTFVTANFILAFLFYIFLRRPEIEYTVWGTGPTLFWIIAVVGRVTSDPSASGLALSYPITLVIVMLILLAIQHLLHKSLQQLVFAITDEILAEVKNGAE